MTQISDLFGHDRIRTYAPDGSRWPEYFGIELEVENCNLPEEFPYWTTHHDGSLREGIEFVLYNPLGGKELESAINGFYTRGLVYTNGPRTSTHIHMNMSSNTVEQVRVMTLIIYAIEDAIFGHVGESRKWAGYAMPLSEMGQDRLRQIFSVNDAFQLSQALAPGRNPERYYGFNVASLRKHGTVEFRYYPGGPTRAELESWLDLAWSMKKLATSISLGDLLDRITDADTFSDLLRQHLSVEWVELLFRQRTANEMFDKYNEAAALCIDADLLERREKLVFLTQPLLKFMNKNLLEDAGRAELAKVSSVFPVLSQGDFVYYFRNAVDADYLAKNKEKEKPKKIQGEQFVWRAFDEVVAPPPAADPPGAQAAMRRYQDLIAREAERVAADRRRRQAAARAVMQPDDAAIPPAPNPFEQLDDYGANAFDLNAAINRLPNRR